MTKFQQTLTAIALALAAGAAQAVTFGLGTNSLYYNNMENLYRTDASCTTNGGCVGSGSGPTGFQLVDPTIANNTLVGDVFAGVIRFQNIDTASGSWLQSGTDQFQGYFAQEIANIDSTTPSATQITLGNVTTDPFGKLGANEMFRLYADSGATLFNDQTGGTAASIIALATDGTFWGSLGITAGLDGGFTYTIDNATLPALQTKDTSYLALNLVNQGPGYNAGGLAKINDPLNESLVGGVAASLVCTPAEIANPAIVCTDFVAVSKIEFNNYSTYGNAGGSSPFIFTSNDPGTMSVPEPGTLALLGLGLMGLSGLRRRVG